MKEIEKGSWQTVVGEQSLGKDIKKRDGKTGRRGRITRYDNKAKTRETEDAKHWRRNPKRRKERGQRAVCRTKRKVWWLGRLETRIQQRRSKLGGV